MQFREVRIKRDPHCPVCGDTPTIRQLIDYEEFCAGPAAKDRAQAGLPREVTVEEVKARRDNGDDFDLLDVRSPEEWIVSHIDGAILIPVGELPARLRELDSAREIIVHCKTGTRSAKAMAILLGAGFTNVKLMRGGITAWTQRIDRTLVSY
jgi:rhodanese-related sulfurtransferase